MCSFCSHLALLVVATKFNAAPGQTPRNGIRSFDLHKRPTTGVYDVIIRSEVWFLLLSCLVVVGKRYLYLFLTIAQSSFNVKKNLY